jgi:hypothetical protein
VSALLRRVLASRLALFEPAPEVQQQDGTKQNGEYQWPQPQAVAHRQHDIEHDAHDENDADPCCKAASGVNLRHRPRSIPQALFLSREAIHIAESITAVPKNRPSIARSESPSISVARAAT